MDLRTDASLSTYLSVRSAMDVLRLVHKASDPPVYVAHLPAKRRGYYLLNGNLRKGRLILIFTDTITDTNSTHYPLSTSILIPVPSTHITLTPSPSPTHTQQTPPYTHNYPHKHTTQTHLPLNRTRTLITPFPYLRHTLAYLYYTFHLTPSPHRTYSLVPLLLLPHNLKGKHYS